MNNTAADAAARIGFNSQLRCPGLAEIRHFLPRGLYVCLDDVHGGENSLGAEDTSLVKVGEVGYKVPVEIVLDDPGPLQSDELQDDVVHVLDAVAVVLVHVEIP